MQTTLNRTLFETTICRFGGPKAPPIPKPPLTSQAAATVNADMADGGRRRQGAGSTILTSGNGVQNQTSKKTILGG